MVIGLTDPSLEGDKLICTIFNDNIQRLPKISEPGDIVICHRLLVEQYGGLMRGSGLPGRGFSCGVVSGDPSSPLVVESGWELFNVTASDLKSVEKLRKWYHSPACPVDKEERRDLPTSELPTAELPSKRQRTDVQLRTVSQLLPPTNFCDLAGQVLAKFRLQPYPECILLRLWDGTDPQVKIRNTEKLTGSDVVDLKLQDDPQLRWLSRFRSIDVAVYDDHMESCADVLPGDCVLLSNLHVVRARPIGNTRPTIQLRLQSGGQQRYGRGVRLLKDAEPEKIELLQRLTALRQKIQVSKPRDEGRRVTVNEVLANVPKATVCKYLLRARVRVVFPTEVPDMLRLLCHSCDRLSPQSVPLSVPPPLCCFCNSATEITIVLQIVFEDSEGEVRAHLWREHALFFLSQFITQPCQLLEDPEVARAVSVTLQALVGLEMDALLVSYLPEEALADVNFLQFQIWDTQLCRE